MAASFNRAKVEQEMKEVLKQRRCRTSHEMECSKKERFSNSCSSRAKKNEKKSSANTLLMAKNCC